MDKIWSEKLLWALGSNEQKNHHFSFILLPFPTFSLQKLRKATKMLTPTDLHKSVRTNCLPSSVPLIIVFPFTKSTEIQKHSHLAGVNGSIFFHPEKSVYIYFGAILDSTSFSIPTLIMKTIFSRCTLHRLWLFIKFEIKCKSQKVFLCIFWFPTNLHAKSVEPTVTNI